MPKKLALNDDEIVLGYILRLEGECLDGDGIVRLYADVLPSLATMASEMFENVGGCNWTRSDTDTALAELSLDARLEKLVPCAIISARNITDAYLRGGRARVMLKPYFRSRERAALYSAINRECAAIASKPVGVRKVADDLSRIFERSDKARESLRRRAAVYRARGAVSVGAGARLAADDGAFSHRELLLRAAKELFPSGLREANAIAVRLTLARAGAGDRRLAEEALKSVCVRNENYV